MILISNYFWHNIQIYHFDPFNILLSIATNVLLMTPGSHIYVYELVFLHLSDKIHI